MRKGVGKVARGALASAFLAVTAVIVSKLSGSTETGGARVLASIPESAPAPSVREMAREIERNLSAYLIAAAHVQSDHPVAPKTAALLDRDPICNQALHQLSTGFRSTTKSRNGVSRSGYTIPSSAGSSARSIWSHAGTGLSTQKPKI
jgi:hypothetical protein